MLMKRLGILALTAVMTELTSDPNSVPAQARPAPDPVSCKGLLSDVDRVASVLSSVPKYASTYVLIIPMRLADRIPAADVPATKEVEVGLQSGTPAVDVAGALGLTKIREYGLDLGTAGLPLQDIAAGKLDAAIMWAPLAGLAIIERGLEGAVSLFTVDRPRAAPAVLHAEAVGHPCALAIADELDASGVLPAELLVPVDIRTLLTRQAPRFSLDGARSGQPLFNEACSKCHGPDAVADPKGLAPVDLRTSVPRFTYPGFLYIILNGRPEKGMPPLRGTVTEEQVALIYQYLKARSNSLLPNGSE
jgi:Cytochrome C oxidase, cbb3-type, subunit III